MAVCLTAPSSVADAQHGADFWRSIRDHDFAVPPGEPVDRLALEICDLAAEPNPVLRDECGYEILTAWVYRKDLLSADQLEAVRQKLIPAMTFHIAEPDGLAAFRRSFSALYMSVLAAHDLNKPYLSDASFRETLDTALKCYALEKDLRGYVPGNGWVHATAHVADLLKFLGRNARLAPADQRRIVEAVAQRCRTVPSVFVWGEDARIAATLLSLIHRKDFDPVAFGEWLHAVTSENTRLWKAQTFDETGYVHVRTQANVLAQLASKLFGSRPEETRGDFRASLTSALSELN
jgi:hypothetical protein